MKTIEELADEEYETFKKEKHMHTLELAERCIIAGLRMAAEVCEEIDESVRRQMREEPDVDKIRVMHFTQLGLYKARTSFLSLIPEGEVENG